VADAYCELTDLLVASCAHCKGISDELAYSCGHIRCEPYSECQLADPADFGPWFTARRAGRCAGCRADVEGGDRIRADGRGGYLCESCGGQT
jgi:hypothetical protein